VNSLTVLPELPNKLEYIDYSYNKLTELPELPAVLAELYCSYNYNIKELPYLPQTLKKLSCNDNNLTELPELPQNIVVLYCSNNNIKYLSPNNCSIVKNIGNLLILNNPISYDFSMDKEFQESL
jgi:Leucine-rich repeat (LRR) protein